MLHIKLKGMKSLSIFKHKKGITCVTDRLEGTRGKSKGVVLHMKLNGMKSMPICKHTKWGKSNLLKS